jgi:hypothetical protein
MHRRLPGVILLAALASLATTAGCGTCVKFESTYDEAWQATRTAILAQPEMRSVNPVERYDTGSFEATVLRPSLRDELHYRVEIRPVGGEERVKRQVCVWVQEVDAPSVDADRADSIGSMKARRRRGLEKSITELIEREFVVPEEEEE